MRVQARFGRAKKQAFLIVADLGISASHDRRQKFVTRGGLASSSEQVVAPKVGVIRNGQRPEPKSQSRSTGQTGPPIRPRRSAGPTSTPLPVCRSAHSQTVRVGFPVDQRKAFPTGINRSSGRELASHQQQLGGPPRDIFGRGYCRQRLGHGWRGRAGRRRHPSQGQVGLKRTMFGRLTETVASTTHLRLQRPQFVQSAAQSRPENARLAAAGKRAPSVQPETEGGGGREMGSQRGREAFDPADRDIAQEPKREVHLFRPHPTHRAGGEAGRELLLQTGKSVNGGGIDWQRDEETDGRVQKAGRPF